MNLQLRTVQWPARRWCAGGLVGLGVCGGLAVGVNARTLSAVELPAEPGAQSSSIAQAYPNSGFTGVQVPYSSITPIRGKVNIRFVNETGSAIDYQVIGETEYRALPGRSEMTLENLPLPTTFTFRRADNGFLQVTLYPNSETGTLTMRVRETPNFVEDRTSVYVDSMGGIYLN